MRAPALEKAFAAAKDEGRAAFVGYLPVGYPSVAGSLEAFEALVQGGADVVEVGIPYSDPVVDGPLIQAAVDVALAGGVRFADVFPAIRTVVGAGAAAVTMGYWNTVEQYGVDRYATALAEAGASGMITPDLLPDEAAPWLAATTREDLAPVFLVAPSSPESRLRTVAQAARGFVYVASTMGVTGTRSTVDDAAPTLVRRMREVTDLPLGVGLGVSTAEQAAQVAGYADGVIVGSALVRALGEGGPEAVLRLAQQLAEGVRSGR